ncbi:Cas8a1 family CRISPR/Cas system-associated protein [Peptoniphilus stercorisuis]|uniref:CRISPR-associated protein Cst1 n=1 Tax=Peptoniphilus stercorisuis TaxID=1436965 RepID=A0ABS4KD71_9FIRM|nr:Cas8a1 family CRISPR/Cas system-associated protein [Peptoniphilus stercorisuis]MBP2025111.1 CRISPR-associated protein Cst1 [Peptoniphilus stercorisuis]
MEYLEFRLDDWRSNVSIIGLMNILDNDKEGQYEIVKNGFDEYLKVSIKSLENFEEKYFKYFIDTYEKNLPWYRMISYKNEVEKFIKTDLSEFKKDDFEKLNNQIDLVKDYLKRPNYTKVFEYIESDIEITKLIKDIKKIKLRKKEEISDRKEEILENLKIMQEIINYCNTETGRKYLGAKGAIFTFINKGIGGVSFLNKQTKEKDIYKDYKEYFLDTLNNYLEEDKKKYKYNCFNCDNKIKNLNTGIGILNDTGFDLTRKPTHVWFEENDVGICDICSFLYSCFPAGFNYSSYEGIFVNANSSIKELKRVNSQISMEVNKVKDTRGISYRALVNTISKKSIEELKYELDDVQVIRYKNEKYNFNILSKYSLSIINDSIEDLESLSNAGYKIGNDYISIYDEVLDRLFNNQNMYTLIYKLFSYKLTNTSFVNAYYNTSHIYRIIRINTRKLKEVIDLGNESANAFVEKYRKYGYFLALEYKKKDSNYENKIRGISYRMLNALKTRNAENFMHNLINSYMYMSISIPKGMVKALENDDNLGTIGYAFVAGLNSYGISDDNKTKEED